MDLGRAINSQFFVIFGGLDPKCQFVLLILDVMLREIECIIARGT